MSGFFESKTTKGTCARCGVTTTWTRRALTAPAVGYESAKPRELAGVCSTCWLEQHPDDRDVQIASSKQKENAKRKREYTDAERKKLPDPRDRSGVSPFAALEDFDDDNTEVNDDDA
jgi:hypothetical protein